MSLVISCRLLVVVLAPVAAVLLPGMAAAQEWTLYGGVGAGYAAIEVEQEPLEPINLPDLSLSRDLEGSALNTQAFAGLRYGKYVGVEAGYFRYGTFKDETWLATPDIAVLPPFPTATYATKLDGLTLFLVGFYPINQELEAFAKVGTVAWDSELTIRSPSVNLIGEADGDDLAFGLGLDYLASGPWRVRLELQYHDVEVTSLDINVTASAIYAFSFGR